MMINDDKWMFIPQEMVSNNRFYETHGRSEEPEDTPAPRGGGAEEQIINSSEADSEAGKTQLQVGKT